MTHVSESVPHGTVLSNWSDRDWSDGVQIEQLPELTMLAVRTAHSLYEITVLDGRAGDVLVRGGSFFPERTPVKLNGSSFGGAILKWRGIYPGLKLEFVPQSAELQSETVLDEITGRPEIRVGYPVIRSSLIQSVERI